MKHNYISSRFLALVLALIVTLLAQVNTSNGLSCYACIFVENNGEYYNTSATCENNPTEAELIPMTRASLATSAAAVIQVLKGIGASQGNPSSIISTNLLNSGNAIKTLNGNSEADATDLFYCTLSTFNLEGFGRIVMRSGTVVFKDLGNAYCDKILPGSSGFELLPITNVDNCYCRVSGCNGNKITEGSGGGGGGGDKAGQSIAVLVFSIGLAFMALISFVQ